MCISFQRKNIFAFPHPAQHRNGTCNWILPLERQRLIYPAQYIIVSMHPSHAQNIAQKRIPCVCVTHPRAITRIKLNVISFFNMPLHNLLPNAIATTVEACIIFTSSHVIRCGPVSHRPIPATIIINNVNDYTVTIMAFSCLYIGPLLEYPRLSITFIYWVWMEIRWIFDKVQLQFWCFQRVSAYLSNIFSKKWYKADVFRVSTGCVWV